MHAHLRRLVIHRFRAVAPDTDLRFHPGINVVVGKNASGKTTLLRLLEAVLSGRMQLLWEEQGSVTAEFDVDGEPVTVHYASEADGTEALEIVAVRGASRGVLRWDQDHACLDVDGEQVRSRQRPLRGEVIGVVSELGSLEWRTTMTPFATHVPRYPEDLGAFDRLVSGEVRVSFGHLRAYQSPAEPAWRVLMYRDGRVIPPWRDLSDPPPPELTLIDTPVEEVAAEMGFSKATATVRANDTGARPVVYSDLTLAFQRRDGTWVRAEHLSWGQKRLLAWWLTPHERYGIADELTNGLHHEWIDRVLDRMTGQQWFLATQNPLLLDHLEFASPDEVEQRIVTCRVALTEDREHMAWSNPTRDEAERFFAAYEVGFQHVSEILKLEGLW